MVPVVPQALLAARGRGEIKRWGDWLDGEGTAARGPLVAAARARGADVPEGWEAWPGKRLLRACLDRSDDAQIRENPIARDEAFACSKCGRDVPPGGRRPRDHCPWCLHSSHVDVVPGDRAAGCGGLLVPVGAERSTKGWMILYRCARCGIARRNRVLDDLVLPDDLAAVRNLVVIPGSSG
jgi:DNA-directed RNA polymerase subunit RPC12/RpoP